MSTSEEIENELREMRDTLFTADDQIRAHSKQLEEMQRAGMDNGGVASEQDAETQKGLEAILEQLQTNRNDLHWEIEQKMDKLEMQKEAEKAASKFICPVI